MIKRIHRIYIILTVIVLLLVVVSFHYLTNFSVYWTQPAIKETTIVGNSTFELLEYEHCPGQCGDANYSCDNYYLFSVNQTDERTLYEFMKSFKPLNGCHTYILFQSGTGVIRQWKEIISSRPDKVTFPKGSFALGFYTAGSFTLTDLEDGKVNGKYRNYRSDGELFIEQEVVNNVSEGKRILYYDKFRVEENWKNNELISIDTIR